MDKKQQVAAIYGGSVLATVAASFIRGNRGWALLRDGAVHGGIIGTGINALVWLQEKGHLPLARANGRCDGMGRLSEKGVHLLEEIPDSLIEDMDEEGLIVGEIPENDHAVFLKSEEQ